MRSPLLYDLMTFRSLGIMQVLRRAGLTCFAITSTRFAFLWLGINIPFHAKMLCKSSVPGVTSHQIAEWNQSQSELTLARFSSVFI